MLYATDKDKGYTATGIEITLKKMNVLRECELTVKNTGIRTIFTVVEEDIRDNSIRFLYEGMPIITFSLEDIGVANYKKIIDFMREKSQTITYRAES